MPGVYPKTNITLGVANLKIPVGNRTPLILAQGTTGGNFTSGNLVTNIANQAGVAATLCGAGSMGQIMIDAFREENGGRLDAIIVSDHGSGVAAAGSVVFTGTPTASGTLNITIGSYIRNRYEIPVTTSSTPTTLGDALVAAIVADTNSPVTAINTAGSVAITAKNKGTEGNRIGLKKEGSATGITVALTSLTSGATDPTLSGVLSKIDLARYDIIAPAAFVSTLVTHLEAKFNTPNMILDGLGFVCKTDTYANHQTALAAGALASQVIVYICNKTVNDSDFKGGALLELDYVLAAKIAALRSLRLTDGAILNSFMIGAARGGAFTAALPYHNMNLNNVTIIPTGKNFTLSETEGLADLGGSTLSMDNGGSVATTNPLWLTCYKAATPTAIGLTYQTANKNDCATIGREYIFNNLKANYAQSALTNGSIPADTKISIANEKAIRAFMVGLWVDLTGGDYTVLQGGNALQEEFNENLEINIDTSSGAVSGAMVFDLMGQLTSFDFNITPQL